MISRSELIIAIAAAGSLSFPVSAQVPELVPATISFKQRTSDYEVMKFAEEYGISPYAVHMWNSGMFGVHRVSPDKAAASVIEDARRASGKMAEGARGAASARAREGLKNIKNRKPGAMEFAKAIVEDRDRNRNIQNAVEHGTPLVFGLEARVPVSKLDLIATDPSVRQIEVGSVVRNNLSSPRPLPPEETKLAARPQSADVLTPAGAAAALDLIEKQGEQP